MKLMTWFQAAAILLLIQASAAVVAFQVLSFTTGHSSFRPTTATCLEARKTKICTTFDPLHLASVDYDLQKRTFLPDRPNSNSSSGSTTASRTALTAGLMTLMVPDSAMAVANDVISKGDLNPSNFNPVCPTSDGFYRFLQSSTEAVVGRDAFVEYGPLIAGGLLRVRLELCVVESFFNEAVGPFIEQNGISWILPLHETVETFLAGVIFALATTFILIGSTKILTIIATYTDLLVGLPARLFGGFFYDRASGKPVTLDVGLGPFKTRVVGPPKEQEEAEEEERQQKGLGDKGPVDLIVIAVSYVVKVFGQILGLLSTALDVVDSFVGKYLVLWASGYILLKFVHFKVFPDFP